jgi:histone H3/H4
LADDPRRTARGRPHDGARAGVAAARIRRAYAYGFSRRRVLEAISCVQNMTGAVSVQLGLRAMQQADHNG